MKKDGSKDQQRLVNVMAYSQVEVLLGTFRSGKLPNGYSIEICTDGIDDDLITTEVVTVSAESVLKMYLFIMNSSNRTAQVSIQSL
jgi:predicted acetyltransferase